MSRSRILDDDGRARTHRRTLRVLVALAVLLVSGVSFAQSARTQFLISRLQYPPAAGQADDFRVRTNAALGLGASNEDAAVQPLCDSLANDPSDVVRQADAVAIKRLGRAASLPCLQARVGAEGNGDVKLQITRAIESIQAATGAGSSGPPTVQNAKYYVQYTITNKTNRPQAEIEKVVGDAVVSQGSNNGVQIAPANQAPAAAKAVISQRHLSGYYLSIAVEPFDGSNGNLKVVVKVAVFTYPGKDLKGEIGPGATAPGSHPGDHGTEDQLMEAVAKHAIDVFVQTFH